MAAERIEEIFMCPRCHVAQKSRGSCPDCGVDLQTCQVGAFDDPC